MSAFLLNIISSIILASDQPSTLDGKNCQRQIVLILAFKHAFNQKKITIYVNRVLYRITARSPISVPLLSNCRSDASIILMLCSTSNYLSASNFGCGLNTFFFAAPFIRFFRLDKTSSPAIMKN